MWKYLSQYPKLRHAPSRTSPLFGATNKVWAENSQKNVQPKCWSSIEVKRTVPNTTQWFACAPYVVPLSAMFSPYTVFVGLSSPYNYNHSRWLVISQKYL